MKKRILKKKKEFWILFSKFVKVLIDIYQIYGSTSQNLRRFSTKLVVKKRLRIHFK